MTRVDLEVQLRELFAAPMTVSQRHELERRFAQTRPTRAVPARASVLRRRRTLLLLAATVGLMLVGAIATLSATPPADPARQAADAATEERLRDDLAPLFADQCLDVVEATTLVRQRLDALGLTEWAIATRAGAENSRCVTAAPVGDTREVLLIPGMGADVGQAMARIQVTLMEECLDRDQARALIASELERLGSTGWSIRTDGPLAYPIDQREAVEDHVAAGCYVYSGSGSSPDGTRAFYIHGRAN